MVRDAVLQSSGSGLKCTTLQLYTCTPPICCQFNSFSLLSVIGDFHSVFVLGMFCSASFFQMALYGKPNQSIFPLWPILLFIWSNQLFIRLTFHFLYGQLKFFCCQLLTFDKINFYFLYGQLDFLCGQCKNADWRLQIRGKMQTWI